MGEEAESTLNLYCVCGWCLRCVDLGAAAMNGPPSLVRYDQPVPAEDQAAQNLQAKLRAAKLQEKNLGNVPNGDDILHMILPPRCADRGFNCSSPRIAGSLKTQRANMYNASLHSPLRASM